MELNDITEKIIGCAIKVHRNLGPGLLESIYESALCIELDNATISHERQKALPVKYNNRPIGEYRIDLLIENQVVVEIKSVERFDPVFQAQLLSYMKLGGFRLGLLINSRLLTQGIKRLIL